MKKRILIAAVLIVAAIIIMMQSSLGGDKVCIKRNCFHVEIAGIPLKRSIGLSTHEILPLNSGMLFVFPDEHIPGFWMKDMNFSLDIIWINSDFEIVGIEKNLQPCVNEENCKIFYPPEKIEYVLEINSGLSDKYGFEKGEKIHLE